MDEVHGAYLNSMLEEIKEQHGKIHFPNMKEALPIAPMDGRISKSFQIYKKQDQALQVATKLLNIDSKVESTRFGISLLMAAWQVRFPDYQFLHPYYVRPMSNPDHEAKRQDKLADIIELQEKNATHLNRWQETKRLLSDSDHRFNCDLALSEHPVSTARGYRRVVLLAGDQAAVIDGIANQDNMFGAGVVDIIRLGQACICALAHVDYPLYYVPRGGLGLNPNSIMNMNGIDSLEKAKEVVARRIAQLEAD